MTRAYCLSVESDSLVILSYISRWPMFPLVSFSDWGESGTKCERDLKQKAQVREGSVSQSCTASLDRVRDDATERHPQEQKDFSLVMELSCAVTIMCQWLQLIPVIEWSLHQRKANDEWSN